MLTTPTRRLSQYKITVSGKVRQTEFCRVSQSQRQSRGCRGENSEFLHNVNDIREIIVLGQLPVIVLLVCINSILFKMIRCSRSLGGTWYLANIIKYVLHVLGPTRPREISF